LGLAAPKDKLREMPAYKGRYGSIRTEVSSLDWLRSSTMTQVIVKARVTALNE
jgi:hypothetical protein